MSKHTQFSSVSFPSSNSGSQVEPGKTKSRRLEFGSLLRSKKLGGADLISKKRALDVDVDVGGGGGGGGKDDIRSTAQPQRVKRTRLHSGVSVASIISNASKLQASKSLESRRSLDALIVDSLDRPRERTSSSSSVRTIRPGDVKKQGESRLNAPRATNKPFDVGPAELAKAVLTPTDVNIPKDTKRDASENTCAVSPDEDVPGWLLSTHRDGNTCPSSEKETNHAFKGLKSVEEFNPPAIEDRNDSKSTVITQECTQPPNVSVKLFKQHVELWDTKPTDVYIYRAQVHLTTPESGFDASTPPKVDQVEISCSSLFPAPSPVYMTYYTGETTPGKRPQIDPSKGIHIGQRWWHSTPKEAGGTGLKGQWGWYMKMWIPIPMYVMRGREMGVFRLSTKVWMNGDEKGPQGDDSDTLDSEPDPLCAEKEFSVSCLRWTGDSFREPSSSSRPLSGFLVPGAWSLVTL